MIDVAELKERARRVLASAVEELRRDGSCNMSLSAIGPDGALSMFAFAGDAANDDSLKARVGRSVRESAARGECVATVLVSDTFYAEGEPEAMGRASAIRRALGLSVEQGARAGLYPLAEAVTAVVESPLGCWHLRQRYRREGASVELVGGIDETEGRIGPGRISGFFVAPAAAGRAS